MSFQRNFTFSLIISESEHSVETSGKGLDVTRVKKLHYYEFSCFALWLTILAKKNLFKDTKFQQKVSLGLE